MKRHVKMSAVLIVLILALSMVFVSCDELEQAVTEIEGAVQDAVDSAKKDLDAAKAELKALIESGDAASATALNDAVAELNAAIDAAEKAAADADAANKTALEAAIAAAKAEAVDAATVLVEAAKTELNTAIEANSAALEAAVATLSEAIATASQVSADADAALAAALEEAKMSFQTSIYALNKKLDARVLDLKYLIRENEAASDEALATKAAELAETIAALQAASEAADVALDEKLTAALAEANTTLQAAIDAVQANLDAKVAELNALIAANKEASDAALSAKAAEIAETITALDAAYKAADVALDEKQTAALNAAKTALQNAVNAVQANLDAAVATLNATINTNKENAKAELAAAVATLNEAIEDAAAVAAAANAADKAELTTAINNAKAELKASIDAVQANLDAAVERLEGVIADNKNAAAEELANAVAALNEAIDLAEQAAADANAADKAELTTAINNANAELKASIDAVQANLDAAVERLEGVIADNKNAAAEELANAVAALNEAIDLAEQAAADANAADKAELTTAINNAKTELQAAIDVVEDKLEAAVEELQAAIDANKNTASGELTAAVEALNAAIEAAKTVAADANAADKAELTTAINNAKTELQAAIDAVQDNLDAAVEELQAAIDANKNTAADDLSAKVAELNAAIEAAKAAAAAADTTAKGELETAIADAKAALTEAIDAVQANLDAAVEELQAAIDTKVDATVYATKIAELDSAIGELMGVDGALDDTYATDLDVDDKIAAAVDALEAAIEALTNDLNTKTGDLQTTINNNKELAASELNDKATELVASIEAAQTAADAAQGAADTVAADLETAIADLTAAIEASKTTAQTAYLAIDKWDSATAEVEAALASIKALRDSYNPILYQENYDTILANHDVAWIKIVRAIDVEQVNAAVEEYKNYLSSLKTLGEVVYAKLLEIAESADAVKCTATVRGALAELRAALNAALAEGEDDIDANIYEFENEAGDVIDLDALCNAYQDKYDALKTEGEDIKADMDDVIAAHLSLTLKAGNVDIDAAYTAWVEAGNEATEIEGFVATKADYDAKKAAIADYEARGNALKAEIDTWLTENAVIVLSHAHDDAINGLIDDYDAWVAEGDLDSVDYIDGLADSKANLDAAAQRIEDLIAEGLAFKAEMITFNGTTTCLTLEAVAADLDARYDAWIAVNDKTMVAGLEDTETAYLAAKANVEALRTEGESIRDSILAEVNKGLVVLADQGNVENLIFSYNTWVANHNASVNPVDLVGGLTDAKVQLDAKKARIDVLAAAKDEADDINVRIYAISLVYTGDATKTVKDELAAITEDIYGTDGWVEKYGLGTAEELDQANYNMVDHAELEAKLAKFDELVGEFERAFEAFKTAFLAIPETLDLLSGDEIAAARVAYDAWTAAANLGTFDYELSGGDMPIDYAGAMGQKEAEFDLLVADALEAYNARFDANLTVGTVNIYNADEVEFIESWYVEFAAKDENDNYVFENGYVLSEDITITAETYAAVVALRSAYDELVAAKLAETAEVNALIAAIGTPITTDSRTAINAALAAREAWLAGDNAPDGYSADQFAIDTLDATYTVDDVTLDDADAACIALEEEAADLKALIAALDEKTVSTDIADDTARAEYQAAIDEIRVAQNAFETNNDGNRGMVTEPEFDKVAAGELALVKYDTVVALKAEAAGWTAEGDFVAAVETVLADAVAAIDDDTVADADAVAEVAEKYSAKLAVLDALQDEVNTKLGETGNAVALEAINAVCTSAIGDIVDDEKDAAAADFALIDATAKFEDLVVLGNYADNALVEADNDASDVAINVVLADAINSIKTVANDDVVELANKKFGALIEVGDNALTYETEVDADGYAAVKNALEKAIATLTSTETDTAEEVEDAVELANAQFGDIKTVYDKYVNAVGAIDPADEVNLTAVANQYSGYLDNVVTKTTVSDVTGLTNTTTQLIQWYIDNPSI